MEAQQFQIKDFTYDLPENKIAKYPLEERDQSKLLIYRNGNIEENIYKYLDKYITEKSLLVFNNTKVIQARLLFKNSSGDKIEIFCLEPSEENPEPSAAMMQQSHVKWECLIGRLDRWKEKVIRMHTDNFTLNAEIIKRNTNQFTIQFSWFPESYTFAEILDQLGEVPIPPYLKRNSEAIDKSRYQTVYAEQKGSVAAPTAGLHFTKTIFEKLRSKNVQTDYVTLHVGAGTFKPVKSETIEGHEMHAEWIEVESSSLEKLLQQLPQKDDGHQIVAVGTTSLRTIESLYWMGIKAHQNPARSVQELEVKQWEAYKLQQTLTAAESLNALLTLMKNNRLEKLICKTQILIVPSYHLKIADALITNFHQPCSTLLLLVAAVTGDDWRKIYTYALDNNFRFLSYGDGSLLFNARGK